MTSPLAFRGRIGRLPYALWSAALFFSQHIVALGLFKLHGATLRADVWFAFVPLRALVAQADLPGPFLLVGFGYLLIRVMVIIVIFVLTVNLLLDRPVIESLLFAVALAVGLSPELLPAIISVTLSAGARAMSKRGVIVGASCH
jgi:hypothetical protein